MLKQHYYLISLELLPVSILFVSSHIHSGIWLPEESYGNQKKLESLTTAKWLHDSIENEIDTYIILTYIPYIYYAVHENVVKLSVDKLWNDISFQ